MGALRKILSFGSGSEVAKSKPFLFKYNTGDPTLSLVVAKEKT